MLHPSPVISPAEFKLFPLLPPEIRLTIWELSFEPRSISLVYSSLPQNWPSKPTPLMPFPDDYDVARLLHNIHEKFWFTPMKTSIPAVFQVNREAREAAMSRYESWAVTDWRGRVKTVRWNPEIDLVALPEGDVKSTLCGFFCQFPHVAMNTRRLALPTRSRTDVINSGWGRHLHELHPWLYPFRKLDELVILLHPKAVDNGGGYWIEEILPHAVERYWKHSQLEAEFSLEAPFWIQLAKAEEITPLGGNLHIGHLNCGLRALEYLN